MATDKKKFKNLVHYICYRSEPQKLGAVKLNKILWYSDVLTYLKTGRSMTGEVYKKRQFGPVPSSILQTLSALEADGSLAIRACPHFGHQKREYIYLTEPDMSEFSGQEVDTINRILEIICDNHTATSISDLTHDRIWELADIGEEIPFHATLAAGTGEITEDDIVWGRECLKAA